MIDVRQTRKKYNIRFTRDGERVSYYQQQHYVFNPEKSSGTQEDNIVVLSMHMNVSFNLCRSQLSIFQFGGRSEKCVTI